MARMNLTSAMLPPWTEMYGVLDSQHDVAATLVLQKQAGEPSELRQGQRILGMISSKLQHRKCWIASWDEAPILKRKLNLHDPALQKAFVEAKKGHETFVVRLTTPGTHQVCNWHDWSRLIKAPARQWAQSILGDSYALGDAFKLEFVNSKDVRGMLRLHTREAAEALIAASGQRHTDTGRVGFL